MRRRSVLWLLGLSAALLSATGCGAANPMRIGIIADYPACSSDFAASDGPAYIAGAELPLLRRGATLNGADPRQGVSAATVSGRSVRLEIACADALDPGSALAQLRWLVEDRHVDAVVGPSVEADPIVARYAKMHPGTVFMLASYDQSSTLRFAARNVFRFELEEAQLSAGLATYAYRRLGWRNETTVGDDQAAGWVQAAGFDAEFCALGGHVTRLWAPGAAGGDKHWVRHISAAADGVFLAPNAHVDNRSAFIKRWGRLHHLARHLVIGWSDADPSNPNLRDVVAVSSYPWAKQPATNYYESALKDAFNGTLDPETAVTYYDEVEPLLEALQQVRGDTSDGEAALQKALAGLQYAGPEGPIHLDKRNQAIGRTYLARSEGGRYYQFQVVSNVEQTFGGYFGPRSRAPGPRSPACVKRKPPPWAAARPTR